MMTMNPIESRYKGLWGAIAHLSIVLPLLLTLLLLCGCRHRLFTMPDTGGVEVQVIYDWESTVTELPKQMSLYLFPVDAGGVKRGGMMRFDSADPKGHVIAVRPGLYHAICVNSDVRGTYMRGDDFEHFLVTTQENRLLLNRLLSMPAVSVPRARGTEDEKVMELPDLLYSDRVRSFEVLAPESGTTLHQTLVMRPRKVTTTLRVMIDRIKNSRHLAKLTGTLTGLATGLHLSGPTATETLATLPFALAKEGEGATATVESFGPAGGGGPMRHVLVVYAILDSGESFKGEYDVTDLIRQAPDPLNRTIHIPLLELPTPIYTGKKDPIQVEQWKEVKVPLPMW